MDNDRSLPGSVLIDLYVRLRDEVDGGEVNLDPNHKLRSRIVMAIYGAAETTADINILEVRVREMLGQFPQPQPMAA